MKESQTILNQKNVLESKKNYQFLWKGVFLFISILFAILLNKIYLYQTLDYFNSIKKGSIFELLVYGLPFGVLVLLVDTLVHYLFDDKCHKYYINCQKYQTEEAQKKRCYTLVKWAYSLFYYGISSIAAYQIIKQTSYMPTWLGGSGSCVDLTRYATVFDQANFEMKVFYVLQFGKHFARFFQHVFIRSEGNFFEYALHHALSTFLIFFSYLTNQWLVGIFVLLIHDISDFFLILARAYRDYRHLNKKILQGFYIMAGSSWVICRIFLLTACCVYSSIYSASKFVLNSQNFDQVYLNVMIVPAFFMAFMLFALQILQLFWTYYIASSFIEVNVSSKVAKHTYD